MKKHCLLQASALLLSLLFLTACGAGGPTSGGDSASRGELMIPPAAGTAPESPREDAGLSDEAASSAPESGIYTSEDNKIIRRASLALQTTDFDTSTATLDGLVTDQGGYYESAEVQQGDYYDSRSARYGSYVVRVPREHYNAFLTAVGEVTHVMSKLESSTDVGEVYADTALRLKTQQTKYDRLLALLAQATLMEDIIRLEDVISQVEYEIERCSTELRRYDGLIGFATITITLQEVLELEETPKETVSLSGRVGNALSAGLSSFGRSVGNLMVWLAYHLVGVVIFLAVVAVAIAVLVRLRKRRRAQMAASIAPARVPEGTPTQEDTPEQ